MRRDAYIENDSGGFSVVSGSAVDDIIADQRGHDDAFVNAHHAFLLLLVGDDSLPVRIVVDEQLCADEEREWLARVRTRLDVPDGRVLVMGGFDPDVLGWWRDEHSPDEDGRGVAVAQVPSGLWDLDVYTYAGSLNGNALLESGPEPAGAWFRRDHPNQPFPLWLAHMLDYSGKEDPGHEQLWRKSKEAFAEGSLAIDTDTRGFVGLLFHLHKRSDTAEYDTPPEDGWFDSEAGARVPERCPLGIVAEVEDPNLVPLAQRLTNTQPPPRAETFLKSPRVDVGATWQEQPLPLAGGSVSLPIQQAWHSWVVAALASGGVPAVEARVSNHGGWLPAENEWLWVEPAGGDVVIGAPENLQGWGAWRVLSALSTVLAGVPDGAAIDLLTSPARIDEDAPGDGRLRLAGKVSGGHWVIERAGAQLSTADVQDALTFASELFDNLRVNTRTEAERAALDEAYDQWSGFCGEDCIVRDDAGGTFKESDIRTLVLIAQPVFRVRFAQHWPVAVDDDNDD